ncbi:hypothetical protein GCM10025734_02850 [Kitasatospora paranensis]|uniref:hypothetical protein n=1 Tax=Kitasatospora paranensis TaxID=258053 RepID=UPI0031E51051
MRPSLSRLPRRPAIVLAIALLAGASAVAVPQTAHASVSRVRLGSSTDVSRSSWSGPAFTMNGDGAVVPATMTKAINAITGGTGSIDVTVLADSAPSSGSATPECDVIMGLSGINSCTTDVVTSAADGNSSQVNTDVRNAEFVYFAGGNQCVYASWKGTALQASVQSVVAKGGGSGGGSAGTHINSAIVYDACGGGTDSPPRSPTRTTAPSPSPRACSPGPTTRTPSTTRTSSPATGWAVRWRSSPGRSRTA